MKTFIQKLNSRKFLAALAGMIGGVVLIANGSTTEGTTALVGSILGYLAAEGLVDLAAVRAASETVYEPPVAEEKADQADDFGFCD